MYSQQQKLPWLSLRDAVTVDDIQWIARKLFRPANLNLVVIGAIEQQRKERIKKSLVC